MTIRKLIFLIAFFCVTQQGLAQSKGNFLLWSNRETFFVLGGRFYPVDPVFIKMKGLIGDDSDVTLGMGYQRGIGGNFTFEGGMDYYFDPGELGIRLGLAYLF